MGHGAYSGNLALPVDDGAGGAVTAADKGRPGAQNCGVAAFGTAEAELKNAAPLRGANDAVGLGGHQGLEVHGQEHYGFDQLRFDCRGHHGHRRFAGDIGVSSRMAQISPLK